MSSFAISDLDHYVEIFFNRFLFYKILDDGFLRNFGIFFDSKTIQQKIKTSISSKFWILKWENGSKNWGKNIL